MSNSDDITPETQVRAPLRDWFRIVVPFCLLVLAVASYAVSLERRFAGVTTELNGLLQQTRTYQQSAIRRHEEQNQAIENNSNRIDQLFQQ